MRSINSALVLVSLFITGCNQSTEQTGRVAIVDLDSVAAQLGRETAIVKSIKEREASLNQQVAGAKSNYENQLRTTKAKLGEEPTQEQAQQFAKLQQQANQKFKQVTQQAQKNLKQHRAHLLQQFREEAKSVAQQVARERGFSLVVTKNDSIVLAFDETADITSAVAQRMQALSHTARMPALGNSGSSTAAAQPNAGRR